MILLLCAAVLSIHAGCLLFDAPTPTPPLTATLTATATATSTATPTPTATPRYVTLPPVEMLTTHIAAEKGVGFSYAKMHFVPADTRVWVIFGWPDEDETMYRAIFEVVGERWKLAGIEPMDTPTPSGEIREAWE